MSNSYFYSKLYTANDCQRKYKLQYIDGIDPGPNKSGDMEYGTAIHAALAAALANDDPHTVFNCYWDSIKDSKLEYSRYNWDALKTLANTHINKFLSMHLKHIKPQITEERMYARIGDVAFEGTADVIGLYKGVPTIIDFKTSAYPYDNHKIRINEQMHIYARLAKEVHGFEATKLVYMVFVKSDGRIQIKERGLTKVENDAIMVDVIAQCKQLEQQLVFPKNTNSCIKGKNICPYFKRCHSYDANE